MAKFVISKSQVELSQYDVFVDDKYYGTLHIGADVTAENVEKALYARAKSILPKLHTYPAHRVHFQLTIEKFTQDVYSKEIKFSNDELEYLEYLKKADKKNGTDVYIRERKRITDEAYAGIDRDLLAVI